MMPTDKLAAVLWEADRHVGTLTEALAEMMRLDAKFNQSL